MYRMFLSRPFFPMLGTFAAFELLCKTRETYAVAEVPVVGGHAGLLGDAERVYKPVLSGRRGRAEVEFYFRNCPADKTAPRHQVCQFMPEFHGVTVNVTKKAGATRVVKSLDELDSVDASSERHVILEDLTRPFHKPCIMDIKMGVQAWDEDAPPEKVEKERSKYPPQQKLGFRFTGMRVWNAKENRFKEHGRTFGYQLDETTAYKAFYEYFHDGKVLRKDKIEQFLQKLYEIQQWFMEQDEHRFYGSSLLFLYDGDADDPNTGVDLRMIDFAHVWPIQVHEKPLGRDTGYLLGLRTIIAILEMLQRSEKLA